MTAQLATATTERDDALALVAGKDCRIAELGGPSLRGKLARRRRVTHLEKLGVDERELTPQ